MTHPQTTLRHKDKDEDIQVDEALAPFLELLWAHDIDTMMSCQDNPEGSGRVWINFPSVSAAEDFLRKAVPHPESQEFPPECLYNRVYLHWFPDAWPRSDEQEYLQSILDFGLWKWTCNLMDIHFDSGDEDREEEFLEPQPWPYFDISVRFPFKDIEELSKNLEANL
jgi:hypothetical protein